MSTHRNYELCTICKNKVPVSSLTFSCYNKHHFCNNCIKQDYCSGNLKRCPVRHCTSCLFHSCKGYDDIDVDSDLQKKARKMFTNPSSLSLGKVGKKANNTLTSLHDVSNASLAVLSKRPVSCPYKNCNKSIAVLKFEDHFTFEHKNVVSITTQLEHRNGLQIHPNDIVCNEKICFVLIKIIEEANKPSEVRLLKEKYKQGLPLSDPIFVLLATRFSPSSLDGTDDEDEESSDDQYSCSPDDKIILWIASTISTNYSYTLAVSTLGKGVRVKYYGPLLTIGEDAKKLCSEGRCLVLSQNHIMGMTGNGQNNVALDVIIHKDD